MQNDFFKKGVQEIISESNLKERMKGKKLRIKYGVDPTRSDIHLGHSVILWKLKELQDAGHKIIFLIGDFTAKIGDPSGRNTTRPILSDTEIKQNAKTYFEQVGKILDVKKTEIRYNSEWFSKMRYSDLLSNVRMFTLASIIDRDDFKKRLQKGIDIGLQEIFYPVMQAYDSVMLRADVEIGGSDQRFNMLAGRDLQKKIGQTPQEIIITKLLVGLDGKTKMSKSAGNYIGITESAKEMFGKIMSLPDSLILDYFELCTQKTLSEIEQIKKALKKENPRNIKMRLAKEIVSLYHEKQAAGKESQEFTRVFSKKEIPKYLPKIKIGTKNASLLQILKKCLPIKSNSELRRLIEQKAVEIDNKIISDINAKITFTKKGLIIKVGKKDWFFVTQS